MWTRRALLKAGGISLFSTGIAGDGPSFLNRVAMAASGPGALERRKVLVTIFQRGAMDGLMAVSPLNEPRLTKLRPRLAMTASRRGGAERLIDLGVDFGLHPAFAPLGRFWEEGRLAIVHAVGSPDPT